MFPGQESSRKPGKTRRGVGVAGDAVEEWLLESGGCSVDHFQEILRIIRGHWRAREEHSQRAGGERLKIGRVEGEVLGPG